MVSPGCGGTTVFDAELDVAARANLSQHRRGKLVNGADFSVIRNIGWKPLPLFSADRASE